MGKNKIIELLEDKLDSLANISIEDQKENVALMLVVTESMKSIAVSLSILYKI